MSNLKVKAALFHDKWLKGTGEHTDEDPFVPQIETIDTFHKEIHDGNAFTTYAYSTDLDTDAYLAIAFTTPNTTKRIHIIGAMSCSSLALAQAWEGSTITPDTGTSRTVVNRDRNSSTNSVVLSIETTPVANTVTINPTVTVPGMKLAVDVLGTTGRVKISPLNKIILKQNTTYVFAIKSLADNGKAGIRLTWYEKTDL